MSAWILWVAVILTLLTSATLLLSRDWRVSLGALGIQYLSALLLVTVHQPFIMGAVKLITGWMVIAILGMTRLGLTLEEHAESAMLRGRSFRLVLMAMVAFVAFGVSARVEESIPGLGLPVITASLLLLGTGILHLGLTSDLLNITLGLLTMLTGFEILYAALESSILVAGLLVSVTLGLGLVGAYLMIAGTVRQESEDWE